MKGGDKCLPMNAIKIMEEKKKLIPKSGSTWTSTNVNTLNMLNKKLAGILGCPESGASACITEKSFCENGVCTPCQPNAIQVQGMQQVTGVQKNLQGISEPIKKEVEYDDLLILTIDEEKIDFDNFDDNEMLKKQYQPQFIRPNSVISDKKKALTELSKRRIEIDNQIKLKVLNQFQDFSKKLKEGVVVSEREVKPTPAKTRTIEREDELDMPKEGRKQVQRLKGIQGGKQVKSHTKRQHHKH